MKRFLGAVAAAAALAVGLVPFAQADVARYQVESATLTVSLEPAYPGVIHIYDVVISPCDGSFAGSATSASVNGATETISGTLAGGTLGFVVSYFGAYLTGYHFDYNGPFAGGTAFDFYLGNPFSPSFTIVNSLTNATFTTYKNHGDYVSSQPKGFRDTAAHSCIGKPIQAG
jgi:hypothetical protein